MPRAICGKTSSVSCIQPNYRKTIPIILVEVAFLAVAAYFLIDKGSVMQEEKNWSWLKAGMGLITAALLFPLPFYISCPSFSPPVPPRKNTVLNTPEINTPELNTSEPDTPELNVVSSVEAVDLSSHPFVAKLTLAAKSKEHRENHPSVPLPLSDMRKSIKASIKKHPPTESIEQYLAHFPGKKWDRTTLYTAVQFLDYELQRLQDKGERLTQFVEWTKKNLLGTENEDALFLELWTSNSIVGELSNTKYENAPPEWCTFLGQKMTEVQSKSPLNDLWSKINATSAGFPQRV